MKWLIVRLLLPKCMTAIFGGPRGFKVSSRTPLRKQGLLRLKQAYQIQEVILKNITKIKRTFRNIAQQSLPVGFMLPINLKEKRSSLMDDVMCFHYD